MPEDGFRLPVSSYEALTQIIRAYAVAKEPAGPEQLSRQAAKNAMEISGNNAFLLATGIVEGGKKKSITEQGHALARALEHNIPGQIEAHWRTIVNSSEFLLSLVSAVRIRKSMDASSLQAHVAYSAGQPKTQKVITGARTVIDILRTAGLVRDEEGNLIAVPAEGVEIPPSPTTASQPTHERHGASGTTVQTVSGPNLAAIPGIALSIQVNIQCSVDEVDGLAPRLRRLLREISDTANGETPDVDD